MRRLELRRRGRGRVGSERVVCVRWLVPCVVAVSLVWWSCLVVVLLWSCGVGCVLLYWSCFSVLFSFLDSETRECRVAWVDWPF